MLKNKYEELLKAEQDRIKGTSFLPSYGKMPVHNEKFNKLVQYLEKTNKKLQVANPTEYQVNLQNLIEKQLEQSRLDILLNSLEEFRKKKADPSTFDKLLFASGFRAWCGAGTDIYKNIKKDLDDPNRMFKIDTICRNHDIGYTKAKTIDDMKEADANMVFEIIQKYIVNFQKNFISGDYKSDFSNFNASYNTVYNYIVSIIEGSVNMYMMYETLKNIGKNIVSVPKFAVNQLISRLIEFGLMVNDPIIAGGVNQDVLDAYERMGIINMIQDVPKIGKTVGSYYFGTMIKDRIFAMGALLGIVYKTVIEELFDIEIISPTKHEVTDEDLQKIIDNFEKLQNEYQKDTNQQPIKISSEWTKEPTEVITIEQLNHDLKDIFDLNTTYIEKVKSVVSEPEPVLTTKSETLLEPVLTTKSETFLEPELEPIDELDVSINDFIEMFDIILMKDMEQFGAKAKEEIKEMSEELHGGSELVDNDEKNNIPLISQDLKKSINQNIFTEPDEKMEQKPNINPLNEAENKHTKISKDEL